MAEEDYDDKTRGDLVYAERRKRTVPVEVEGAPPNATEEIIEWRFCYDDPNDLTQGTCGPWVVNKSEAVRQGIEYSRTGQLIQVLAYQ